MWCDVFECGLVSLACSVVGDVNLVWMLYAGTVQRDGVSPLCLASQKGHVEVVRALLGAGADVGQATVSGACSVVSSG